MWKVFLEVEEVKQVNKLLKSILDSKLIDDIVLIDNILDVKNYLEDKIQIVECENKVVEEYLESLREYKSNVV